jgi:hypothetical protein
MGVSITLFTDGRDLIPARWIAMTNGEAAAVPAVSLRLSCLSLEGTKRPMTVVPQT